MNTNLIAAAGDPQGVITNPILGNLRFKSGIGFFTSLIPALVAISLVIGTIYFFFMLIMGAIAWISSGGDKGALEVAKSKITNALIGVVILFGIYAIVKLVETFFGISILTLDIGSLVIQ